MKREQTAGAGGDMNSRQADGGQPSQSIEQPSSRMTRSEELQEAASGLLLPLRVTAPHTRPFRARVESAGDGLVRAGLIQATSHTVRRGPRVMSSTDPDLFKVTLHRHGSALAGQDGRQHRVATGEMLVLDTSRAYELILPDQCEVVVLGLPRGLLGPHAQALTRRSGTSIPTGTGVRALCAAVLSDAGDHLDALTSPRTARSMSDALTGLLISSLADIPTERVELPGLSLLERIMQYALANIRDPELTGAAVARAHHISLRRLQHLFQGEERTFRAWLLHERLRRIRHDLSDPGLRSLSASAIAESWGIQDTAHLARRLRREFGCTVTDLRQTTGNDSNNL
ncbi:helix-turn-helix domain-containing protein [Streptomyces niveus]|uniref:AraC-like ligand-binding domain-containing protein n=1 Tax=Streptomyces niveus TaxID=193462 RepID=UPI0036D3DFB3